MISVDSDFSPDSPSQNRVLIKRAPLEEQSTDGERTKQKEFKSRKFYFIINILGVNPHLLKREQ